MGNNDSSHETLSRLVKTRKSIRYLYSWREATVPVHASTRGMKAEEQ